MNSSSKFFPLVISGILLLIMGGCSKNSYNPTSSYPTYSSPTPSSPSTINIQGMSFNTAALTVAPHTTVTWVNNSGITHSVTSNTGKWTELIVANGSSVTVTFDSTGVYPYHCKFHAMMTGSITVQ